MKNLFKIAKSKLFVSSLFLGLSCLSFAPQANADVFSFLGNSHHKNNKESAEETGLKLETKFWKAVQDKNVKKTSKIVSSIFQGVNDSGVISKDEFLAGLAGLDFTSFSFNNFVATKKNDELVVTYDLVLKGSKAGGHNISVYKHADHDWKLVSHSYLPE